MKTSKKHILAIPLILLTLSFSGCVKRRGVANLPIQIREELPGVTITPSPTATFTAIPQPVGTAVSYGPNQGDFPEGINPLTGLAAPDPSLLKAPALLISVPHFPVSARPQSGLSFAPWVFEFLIGEGTTRLLAVFFGEQPFEENALVGDCEIRTIPFVREGESLGNFVWLDKNGDGIQSAGEPGVGGVCVNLYNENGKLIQQTSTDSNGYYGFAVDIGKSYQIEFILPEKMDFSPANLGDEKLDSDANPLSGRTGLFTIANDYFLVDAGLIQPPNLAPILPGGQVGPIRSGRLLYIHVQNFFQYSCLIISGATDTIIDQLPICSQVHNTKNNAGSMLEIDRMNTLSEKNAINRGSNFNYASNLFSEIPPAGGIPADQVSIFVSSVNQTKWIYDPLSKSWARYVDNASEELVFYRDIDKLTGRELSFENLIVLFVEHEILRPRVADMHMELGEHNKGFLFRDGQKYKIKWSTRTTDYERSTGLRRPPAFQDSEGNPIALRPGHTWILIATPYSTVTEPNTHQWKVRVYSPPGFGEY